MNNQNEKIIKKEPVIKNIVNFNNELPKTETENRENYDMEKNLSDNYNSPSLDILDNQTNIDQKNKINQTSRKDLNY